MTTNEKLQEYFDFTESDLEENRQGRITKDQELIVKDKTNTFNNRAIVIVMALLLFYFISLSTSMTTREILESNFLFVSGAIIVGMALFLLLRTSGRNDYTLNQIEGKVNFVWVEERSRGTSLTRDATVRSFKMRVKTHSFDVTEELMDIIDQGDVCRIYYTSGGDILSMESVKETEK